MMFVQHQITEEPDEERLIGFYTLWRITIVRTNKGIAEVPRVVGKQIVVHIETDRAQIFDDKHRRCSCVALTERMVLPYQGDEIYNVIDDFIRWQSSIIKFLFLLNVISQRHQNVGSTAIHNAIALQHPFLFADVIGAHLTGMFEYSLKQVPMYIQELQCCKRERLLTQ